MNNRNLATLTLALSVALTGCQSVNYSAPETTYDSVNQPSERVNGAGVESQDIAAMTDQMARDMMSNPTLVGQQVAPRVVVDSKYFSNESSTRLNKNMITDRLRVNLNRAASGRLLFVNRENLDMINAERELKRDGSVDAGTKKMVTKTAGADYRLVGRISSLDSIDVNTSTQSRYHQIMFEMVDLELGIIVWSGLYEFKKSTQDDVIYR